MSLFKIEYLNGERGEVVDFRYFHAGDREVVELVAKLGLDIAAERGAELYRVLDPSGEVVAKGPKA